MLRSVLCSRTLTAPLARKAPLFVRTVPRTLAKSFKRPLGAASNEAGRIAERAKWAQIPKRNYCIQTAFRDLNKTELESIMEGGPDSYFLIDVREPMELQHGVVPTSRNIPLKTIPKVFAMTPDEFEAMHGFRMPMRNDKVIFCCKSGVRSGSAAKYLAELGYRDVNNYPGFSDWFGKSYE